MRALVLVSAVVLAGSPCIAAATTGDAVRPVDRLVQLGQTGERVGQDPLPEGADALPGAAVPGKRIGNDPDVPGGSAPGTPNVKGPDERVGHDPDVPQGDAPVR